MSWLRPERTRCSAGRLPGGRLRPARPDRGLCRWHYQRWLVRAAGPRRVRRHGRSRLASRSAPAACQAPGCGYAARRWACATGIYSRYLRAGQAGCQRLDGGRAARDPAGAPGCLPGSRLRPVGPARCRSARSTRPPGKLHGRPDAAGFAAGYGDDGESRPRPHRPAGAARAAAAGMQYALQARSDAGRQKVRPGEAQRAVKFTAAAGVASLLDWAEDRWRQHKRRPARQAHRDHAPVADHLCPPAGRGPGRRQRLGRRVSPRHLAAAQPRHQRPDRERPLRRHPPAVAEGPGQALDAGGGWAPGSSPGLPARGARVLTQLRRLAGRPGRASPASRRSPGRCSNATSPTCMPSSAAGSCSTRHIEHAQRLPHRGPPARMGSRPARQRDDLPRGLPQARGKAAPGAGRARHGPGRGPRQPGPVDRPRPPADHAHPDPLRAARRGRLQAALRTASSADGAGALPALLQPQDETRGARPPR